VLEPFSLACNEQGGGIRPNVSRSAPVLLYEEVRTALARLSIALAAVLMCTSLLASSSHPWTPITEPGAQSDLDAFMQKVLARRDENWKKLQQYILDEAERIEIRGPSNLPIWGDKREYTWYIREGYFVRSPLKANGVEIAEADRRKAEETYLRRVKARDKRGERGRDSGEQPPPEHTVPEAPKDVEALLTQTRQPDFINSAYFLRFKFEEGKYALVGRETFDGREVLRIARP